MTPKLLLLMAAMAIISSCSTDTSLSDNDKKSIINEVKQTLHKFNDDMEKNGLMAEFNYFDSSADFFWVPPGYASMLSYDSVRTILTRNAPRIEKVDNRFDSLHIVPLAHNLASYTARIHSMSKDTSGQEYSFVLLETGVMVKRSQGWRMLNGHTTVLR